MPCIGVASYSTLEIYVSDPSATIHEFGHFLDWTLGFPTYHEELYEAEARSAADTVLRDCSATNRHKYFAGLESGGRSAAILAACLKKLARTATPTVLANFFLWPDFSKSILQQARSFL